LLEALHFLFKESETLPLSSAALHLSPTDDAKLAMLAITAQRKFERATEELSTKCYEIAHILVNWLFSFQFKTPLKFLKFPPALQNEIPFVWLEGKPYFLLKPVAKFPDKAC
jgi:hypothetical protein